MNSNQQNPSIDFDALEKAIKATETPSEKDEWYLPVTDIQLADLLLRDAKEIVRLARIGASIESIHANVYTPVENIQMLIRSYFDAVNEDGHGDDRAFKLMSDAAKHWGVETK